jgi:hypothetical protein
MSRGRQKRGEEDVRNQESEGELPQRHRDTEKKNSEYSSKKRMQAFGEYERSLA